MLLLVSIPLKRKKKTLWEACGLFTNHKNIDSKGDFYNTELIFKQNL